MIFDRLDSSEDLLFRSHEDQQLEKSQGLNRILFAVITELSCEELRNVVNVDGVQAAHIEVIQTEVVTKTASTNAPRGY